jgi:hypothetical protein
VEGKERMMVPTLQEFFAKMTPEQRAAQERRDQQQTAMHEAGHVIVAASSGLGIQAWINKNPTQNPATDSTWVGTSEVCRIDFRTGKMLRPSKATLTQIGVAGITAEAIYEEPECDMLDIVDAWRDGWCQPSDRANAVEQALIILRRERRFFEFVAAALMKDGVLTDGQIGMLADELLVQKSGACPRLRRRHLE